MTDVDGILASITQRETWAQEAYGANLEQLQFFHMHFVASDCDHVLAVLAVAREEMADAVSQQERHETGRDGERWWCTCTAGQPITVSRCPDAEQANRTLARLAALYGATLTMT